MKLVVYDRTDVAPIAVPRIDRASDGTAHGTGGLSRWWRIGAALHRGSMRAAAVHGASGWREAIAWAVSVARARGETIAELQAWGHGGWGFMNMGDTRLDVAALDPQHALAPEIDSLRDALAHNALIWFRCCSTFGTEIGHRFAMAYANRLRARVAGHTFIIGAWQSGTHSLAPGARADWSEHEGLEIVGDRRVAAVSSADAPRTIFMLRGGLPKGW
jgi:hypothetical protein